MATASLLLLPTSLSFEPLGFWPFAFDVATLGLL